MQQQTFTTLIRRRYDGTSYNFGEAKRNGREFAYVDVTIRAEVLAWQDGFPLFGLCVAEAPAVHPVTGSTIFAPEDEVALNAADVRALSRECAEYFAQRQGELLRDRQEYSGPGADELVDFQPDYDAAEVAQIGFRAEPVYYPEAA